MHIVHDEAHKVAPLKADCSWSDLLTIITHLLTPLSLGLKGEIKKNYEYKNIKIKNTLCFLPATCCMITREWPLNMSTSILIRVCPVMASNIAA